MSAFNNQPIFRSNAIKHYMQGREKHEFPRFVSLPITILLWVLLVLFVAATMLVWSEQVPTYAAVQGIVVVQPATQVEVQPTAQPAIQPTIEPTAQPVVQPAIEPTAQPVMQSAAQSVTQQPLRKSVPVTKKLRSTTSKPAWAIRRSASETERPTPVIEESASPTAMSISAMEESLSPAEKPARGMEEFVSVAERPMPMMEKSGSVTEKPSIPTTVMVVLFFPPAQAQNLYAGMAIGLNINASGRHITSQITKIVPGAMNPAALRSLYHLENTPLSITQPAIVVVAKLEEALATTYAGSQVTATLQVGSQRLISFLPGIGGLFGN